MKFTFNNALINVVLYTLLSCSSKEVAKPSKKTNDSVVGAVPPTNPVVAPKPKSIAEQIAELQKEEIALPGLIKAQKDSLANVEKINASLCKKLFMFRIECPFSAKLIGGANEQIFDCIPNVDNKTKFGTKFFVNIKTQKTGEKFTLQATSVDNNKYNTKSFSANNVDTEITWQNKSGKDAPTLGKLESIRLISESTMSEDEIKNTQFILKLQMLQSIDEKPKDIDIAKSLTPIKDTNRPGIIDTMEVSLDLINSQKQEDKCIITDETINKLISEATNPSQGGQQ